MADKRRQKMRAEFPKSIRVAGSEYPVNWGQNMTDSIGCWSRADGIEINEILLDNADSGAVIANTLLHELTHAAAYHYSASKNQGKLGKHIYSEEDICEIVGNGFQQIFRDNPKLVSWIAKYA